MCDRKTVTTFGHYLVTNSGTIRDPRHLSTQELQGKSVNGTEWIWFQRLMSPLL